MIIIPAMKIMVAQLIPLVASSALPAAYQKLLVKILDIFSVSRTASMSFIMIPNTPISVVAPQNKVT